MNYFSLLGVPESLYVDTGELLTKYLEATKSAQKNKLVDVALINQAYHTLNDKLKRAEYFLSLRKIYFQPDEVKITDSFLEEVANYRIKMSSAVGVVEKDKIKSIIDGKINDMLESMQKSLDKGRNDLVASIFIKIKYLSRIIVNN